jgi:antitoxin YefM
MKPVAVGDAEDALDPIQETVAWRSMPGIRDDVEEAQAALKAAETIGARNIRARFELPKL